jgi:hypothetical protein
MGVGLTFQAEREPTSIDGHLRAGQAYAGLYAEAARVLGPGGQQSFLEREDAQALAKARAEVEVVAGQEVPVIVDLKHAVVSEPGFRRAGPRSIGGQVFMQHNRGCRARCQGQPDKCDERQRLGSRAAHRSSVGRLVQKSRLVAITPWSLRTVCLLAGAIGWLMHRGRCCRGRLRRSLSVCHYEAAKQPWQSSWTRARGRLRDAAVFPDPGSVETRGKVATTLTCLAMTEWEVVHCASVFYCTGRPEVRSADVQSVTPRSHSDSGCLYLQNLKKERAAGWPPFQVAGAGFEPATLRL